MESPHSPPKRRSIPHIVEPTFHSLRASEFNKESYGAVDDFQGFRVNKDNVELEHAMANSFHERTSLRVSWFCYHAIFITIVRGKPTQRYLVLAS